MGIDSGHSAIWRLPSFSTAVEHHRILRWSSWCVFRHPRYHHFGKNKIENIEALKNRNFIAFTGIGNPYSFFNTLLDHNVKIIKQIIYQDHFQFTKKNYKVLSQEAENNKCNLITTEKDYVRINNQFKERIYYTKLSTLLIEKESLEKELKNLF